jgi:hypothetical protein
VAKLCDLKHHETRKKPLIVQFSICFHSFRLDVLRCLLIHISFVVAVFIVIVVVIAFVVVEVTDALKELSKVH